MDRIAEPGQGKSRNVFAAKLVEDGLPFTKMLKTRRRNRQLEQVTLARIRIHVHQALGILERQRAKEKVVDQTEDRGVESDAERERNDGDQSESRRFVKFMKSEAKVAHRNFILFATLERDRPLPRDVPAADTQTRPSPRGEWSRLRGAPDYARRPRTVAMRSSDRAQTQRQFQSRVRS